VLLILRSRRLTRGVRCAHYARTGGGEPVDVRAARADRRTPLLVAPGSRTRRSPPSAGHCRDGQSDERV